MPEIKPIIAEELLNQQKPLDIASTFNPITQDYLLKQQIPQTQIPQQIPQLVQKPSEIPLKPIKII